MNAPAMPTLTARQRAVMERIDRRVPIKVIANELGVSETRINQHIRALKNIYQAESLNELVEIHRAFRRSSMGAIPAADSGVEEPYRNPEYSKNQLTSSDNPGDLPNRDDQLEQSAGSHAPGPSEEDAGADQSEPQVVPGMLDGEQAVLLRFAAIVGIAFGILAAVVLSVTAAMALSEAMEGRLSVPVES